VYSSRSASCVESGPVWGHFDLASAYLFSLQPSHFAIEL
jgi:hypothetical protein